jgi:hypothetical protein
MSLWPNKYAEQDRLGQFLFCFNLVAAATRIPELVGFVCAAACVAMWCMWLLMGTPSKWK